MIVILGLVILVAALIAGVAGVLANGGHAHAVTHFAVFGYHVTGSTGTLFLYGIVVGALAVGLQVGGGCGIVEGAEEAADLRATATGAEAAAFAVDAELRDTRLAAVREELNDTRDGVSAIDGAFCAADVIAASARDGVFPNPSGPGWCDTVPEAFRSKDRAWPIIASQFHAEQKDFATAGPGEPGASVDPVAAPSAAAGSFSLVEAAMESPLSRSFFASNRTG